MRLFNWIFRTSEPPHLRKGFNKSKLKSVWTCYHGNELVARLQRIADSYKRDADKELAKITDYQDQLKRAKMLEDTTYPSDSYIATLEKYIADAKETLDKHLSDYYIFLDHVTREMAEQGGKESYIEISYTYKNGKKYVARYDTYADLCASVWATNTNKETN